MSKQIDIDTLVSLAQKGDSESFGLIYDELVDKVYRYIYFKTPSVEIAEDLTEDVFFNVWKNLPKYKKQKHPFSAWVFRIAHNQVIDYYRQNKEFIELDETLTDQNTENKPQRLIEKKLIQKEVQIALKELPDQQAQAVILKYINDFSNYEIAQTMQKSETAVRILLSRGLAKLKKVLAGKGIENLT